MNQPIQRCMRMLLLLCLAGGLSAQQNTSIALTSSQNPANPDQSIAFTAAVSPATATGTVTLLLGTKVFMSGLPLNAGTVTMQTQLPLGTYSLTAAYSGDQNDNPSTSAVLTQVVTSQPVPTITSINDAATDGWPASGAAASIFGTFPGVTTTGAARVPLPYILAGVSVFVDGVRAPLYYVSASQINVQVPWEVVNKNAVVSVTNGVWNLTLTTSVLSSWPGLFSPILHATDYSLVSASNPAVGGEVVLLYATGLGPVTPEQTDGTEAPAASLATTKTIPFMAIGGQPARVLWAGLAPGFVGLYQINASVPTGLASGNNNVVVTVGGVQSNPILIAVRGA